MIERETITDKTEVKIVLRFVRERNWVVRRGPHRGAIRSKTEYRYACRLDRWPPGKHEWLVSHSADNAHGFDDVAWARRYSKIVKVFKAFTDGEDEHGPGWEAQIVEMTFRHVETRETKQLYPIVDAIEALANLGRAVTGEA